MIVLDIETSGMDFNKCGIWQVGAIDLETNEEYFDECRIDEEDKIINNPKANKTVLEVIGKTEEELREKSKQSQKEMLEKLFKWLESRKFKNLICQNPQFDIGFINTKAIKYGLEVPFHYRAFDLHTLSQAAYYIKNKKLLVEGDHSHMGLKNILEFCGMSDERGAHNALEDAKLEAECWKVLLDKLREENLR